jgi:pyruvate/2-oxoglutarate dehydrogenase complex dihydrolipoamide acyltransferase (E2) component
MSETGRIVAERKHTLFFLRFARAISPVFLDTDVDMTRIRQHREVATDGGHRYSIVSYVIWAASRVLARHPEANAAISGGLLPRIVQYRSVDAKLALDKTVNGQRIVLSVPIVSVDTASLEKIQKEIDRYRTAPVEEIPEALGILRLHRLPASIGWVCFLAIMGRLRMRRRHLGTFAISSLGHRPVNGFHAVGGTAITLNLGQMKECAVVRDGKIAVAPQLRLNMSFDHRILDGANAADILTELKDTLESGCVVDEVSQTTDATEHLDSVSRRDTYVDNRP